MKTVQIYKAFTAFFALMTVSAVAIVLRPDSELAVLGASPGFCFASPGFCDGTVASAKTANL